MVQEANTDAAETEFRGRLFRHRFLYSSMFHPGSTVSAAAALTPVAAGVASPPGIPSGTLVYQMSGHPQTSAAPAVAPMHLRDKPAHDAAGQVWPAAAYPAGGPPLHSRGGHAAQAVAHDQHGMTVSPVPLAQAVADPQGGPGDAVAVMRLTGRAVAQQPQQMRYAGGVVPHQYVHMHGGGAGLRMVGHEAVPHDGDHSIGGRFGGAEFHGQHGQRGAGRPNTAMSAPAPGMPQMAPPAPSMHADVLHQRSMPGSPTDRGMATDDVLQSYAAAAAPENKRDGVGAGAVYDGLRGRKGPHVGSRVGGGHAGTRQRSATQLSFGPQPPPPPQPSGRHISPEGVYVHVEQKGPPQAQALHLRRGHTGTEGIAAAPPSAHPAEPHGLRAGGQYYDTRGAPVATAAQHVAGPTTFYVQQPMQRGGPAAGEVSAAMQQITAIGLPSAAAQGATFAGSIMQGTPVMMATGQGVALAHSTPAQQRPQQQVRGMAAGGGGAGQHGGGGQAAGGAPQPTAGMLKVETQQPVTIQLGEHQRELFQSTVDPVYSHIIRTVHPPFNSYGV